MWPWVPIESSLYGGRQHCNLITRRPSVAPPPSSFICISPGLDWPSAQNGGHLISWPQLLNIVNTGHDPIGDEKGSILIIYVVKGI